MGSNTMSDEVRNSLEKMASKLKEDDSGINEDEIIIDDTYTSSMEDIEQRLARLARNCLEGKLEPSQEVKEFWKKVKKRKNADAISDDNFNEGE